MTAGRAEKKGRKGKNAGEPAFVQKGAPRTATMLVGASVTFKNGEAFTAHVGPTPSGPHPLRQKLLSGWR